MKLKCLFTTLAIVMFFSACSDKDSDKNPIEIGDTKAVYLQIKTNKTGTKANEPTQTGESAELLSAIIYFLDGATDPLVYAVRTVGVVNGDISMEDLEEGYLFEGIPSNVTQVYVVGNYNSSDRFNNYPDFPTTTGSNLSDIESTVMNIEEVNHGSLSDGTTYGDLLTIMQGRSILRIYGDNPGGWNGDVTPGNDDNYAEVLISPVVSRIEIVRFTYSGTARALTLAGIYINNYYQNAPLDLDLTGAPVNNGSNVDNYDPDSDDFQYTNYMTMFDLPGIAAVPANETATFVPSEGTFAYQVFGNSSPVPHIIVKFSGVTAGNGTFLGDRYITVRGFLDPDDDEITEFERNTIYKITNFTFTDDDLDILPETEEISIWVHVEVQPWTTVEVTPII